MFDWVKNHGWDLWSAVAGLFGGATIGSILTVKFIGGQNIRGDGSNINQSRARAGGDVVGGNKSGALPTKPGSSTKR